MPLRLPLKRTATPAPAAVKRPPPLRRVPVNTMPVTLGEVTPGIRPDKWHGWPNGSACFDRAGSYLGRWIEKDRQYHVLRWQPAGRGHAYLGVRKTFEEAIAALK